MLKLIKIFSYFYKYLVYTFFQIIYGPINSVDNTGSNKNVKIKDINLNNLIYKIFICSNSRLYTDTIHDTAIINDNKILSGPSFQYRKLLKNHTGLANADCKFNSVFTKGTPRIKKKFRGSLISFLTGGGGNYNYWHWLFDVLPRFHLLEKANFDLQEIDYFLFPNLNQTFQRETLDLMSIPNEKRLSSQKFRHIQTDKIIITAHPYNILNNPKIDSLNIPNWIYQYLKSLFLQKCLLISKIKSFPDKIYINRKDTTSPSLRRILNLNDFEDLLEAKGFKSLTLSNFSFYDQVALFYNAKQIIGLHGAGFANLIFCKPKTSVIEIQPSSAGEIILNLSKKNFLNYRNLSLEPKTINHNNQSGDLEVELKDVTKILSS